jgi:RNA polymerase sigma-70 factor, ECF subfamily
MTDFDERALVERCRTGDDAAFGELVDRYRNLVYAIVGRMVPERALADDLAQEVFLRIHRGLPYFRGDARLSTWIYRIVANVCVEARGRRRLDMPLDERRDDRRPMEPASIDSSFADFELRDRLEKAIAQLPDNYRLLIAAHYLDGVQYDALAEALGIPIGTVKTHLYRAKRKLRELLQ